MNDLQAAQDAGAEAGNACQSKAERVAPGFSEQAYRFLAALVRIMPYDKQVSCESMVTMAERAGIKPHDSRAFGPIFKKLAQDGVIRRVGVGYRIKGHGTAGASIYTRGN